MSIWIIASVRNNFWLWRTDTPPSNQIVAYSLGGDLILNKSEGRQCWDSRTSLQCQQGPRLAWVL